jgi:hypothetical protein
VRSDRRLSLYAAWFENCFGKYPEIENFSLTGGGLAINGLAIAGLEAAGTDTFLALPDRRTEIDVRLEAVSRVEAEFFEPKETEQRGRRYESAIAALRSSLERIKKACEEGERIASGALHARRALTQNPGPGEQEKILAGLDAINSLIGSSEVKDIAGFLFPPQSPEASPEAPHEAPPHADGRGGISEKESSFTGYLAASAALYSSLARAVEATLPLT